MKVARTTFGRWRVYVAYRRKHGLPVSPFGCHLIWPACLRQL